MKTLPPESRLRFHRRVGLLLALVLVLASAPAGPASHLAAQQTRVTPQAKDDRQVSIDFNDVDINVFVKFISELTGRNFIIDQRIKGRVTVISPSRISVDEAYRVFESVLEVHGFTAVEAGSITKIVPSADARSKSVETRETTGAVGGEDRIVTQLVPLTHASSQDVAKLIKPLVNKTSIVLPYDKSNTLIITDTASNINRLLTIIESIDVVGAGQQIAVVPLAHAQARETQAILASAFNPTAKGKTRGGPSLNFIHDERTNALVIVGSEEEINRARQLVALLDKELPRGNDRVNVIFLEYANAEEMAAVLQNVQSKGGEGQPEKVAPVISDGVVITADTATNSLVVKADRNDFQAVQDIVAQLDIPRSMVYIESLIMEVDVDRDFQFGTEWQAVGDFTIEGRDTVAGGGFKDSAGLNTSFDPLSFPAGGSIGIFTEQLEIGGIQFQNLSAVVNAFKDDRDITIIATPQILTTDNEEAEIFVGENVPYQTTTSTSDNDTFNSFEYRDVGNTLKITPQITRESLIRLNIFQEISTVVDATDNRPTTLNRNLNTTVLVRNGSTVVIGGLIGNNTTVNEFKVPFLGDIPVLGWLFKSEGKTSNRTNLFVFLSPRVVTYPNEAEGIYKEKRHKIESLQGGVVNLSEYFHQGDTKAAPEGSRRDSDAGASLAGGPSAGRTAAVPVADKVSTLPTEPTTAPAEARAIPKRPPPRITDGSAHRWVGEYGLMR